MALSVKVGTFNARTTTGSQSITGVGFQPKALLLGVGGQASPGTNSAIMRLGFGMSTSTVSRVLSTAARGGGTTTGNVNGENTMAAAAIRLLNTFGVVHFNALLTSFDADGFTLNYDIIGTSPSAWLIGYMALGGTDIDVAVGDFLLTTSTGDQDITGLPFAPDAVLMAHTNQGSALPYINRTNAIFGMGVGVSTTQRWASIFSDRDQVLPTESARYQRSDRCLVGLTAAHAIDFEADYSGALVNGFRVNKSDAPAADVRVAYLAIKGATFSAGLETQRTSIGTKSTTVTGTPKVAFFFGNLKTAGTTVDTASDAAFSLGFDDGTGRWAVDGASDDNVSTVRVVNSVSDVRTIVAHDPVTPSLTALGTNVAFTSNTMTIDWTTADATAREFGYLAITEGAPSTLYGLTPSDTAVTNTDSVALKPIYPVSDTGVTNTDSIALRATIAVTDTATSVSDTVALGPNLAVSDTGTSMTDSVAAEVDYFLTVSDNGTNMSDGVTLVQLLQRTASDTGVTNTDSVSIRPGLAVTDTAMTMTDSLTLIPVFAVTLTDQGTDISESIALVPKLSVVDTGTTITEDVALMPNINATDTGVTITESTVFTHPISITDTGVTMTDSAAVQYIANISISDTALTITESVARQQLQGIADNITLTETISAAGVTTATTAADALTVTDDAFSGASVEVFDTVSVGEALSTVFITATTTADTITVTDATPTLFYKSATSNSDTITVTDDLTVDHPAVATVNDSLSVFDDVNTLVFVPNAVSDSITVSEALITLRTVLSNPSDTINVSDAITVYESEKGASITDSISISEQRLVISNFVSAVSDTISVSDTALGKFSTSTTASDTVTITDAPANAGFINNMVAADTIGISDVVVRTRLAATSAMDTIGISDAITAGRSMFTVNEAGEDVVAITDSAAGIHGYLGGALDAISIADLLDDFISVDPGDDIGILSDVIDIDEFVEGRLGHRVVVGVIVEDDLVTQL